MGYCERRVHGGGRGDDSLFSDPQVVAVGDEYLHIVAWTFARIWRSCRVEHVSGDGQHVPALVGSTVRIIVADSRILLSRLPGFALRWIWYLSIVAISGAARDQPDALQPGVPHQAGVQSPIV